MGEAAVLTVVQVMIIDVKRVSHRGLFAVPQCTHGKLTRGEKAAAMTTALRRLSRKVDSRVWESFLRSAVRLEH